jgi:hypothetical protein
VWKRDTAPEPPPTPEQAAAAQARAEALAEERARREAQAQAEREAAASQPPPVAAPPPPPPASPDKCDEAKAFAARLRTMTWLGLDDAQQQRLYGYVIQQCAAAATDAPQTP